MARNESHKQIHTAPKDEVYWYTLKKCIPKKLEENIEADIVVIGGGIAGLMCAQRLRRENKNMRIVVLEATICGGGASGKSSGFITPDSELELSDLVLNYGDKEGKRIWEFVKGGVRAIRETIEKRNIECDFSVQDSLFVANDNKGYKKVISENTSQHDLGYESWLYSKENLKNILGSEDYYGAVRYKDTFAIISYLFCQGLKEVLIRDGVEVYEETPVSSISSYIVKTHQNTISAQKIVVCTDHFLPKFNLAKNEIYHAQTFLAVSKPLSMQAIRSIFPEELLMVWDTDLIYQYYRIVQGNRLLIGAASLLYTYAHKEKHMAEKIFKKMNTYLNKKFPQLDIGFEYMWPGLIGVSKDFLPIAGKDKVMDNVYFVGAGAGLPWAAALGEYIAEKILIGKDDFDETFSPGRHFPINDTMQYVLSKPWSFALSHGIKKYFNR